MTQRKNKQCPLQGVQSIRWDKGRHLEGGETVGVPRSCNLGPIHFIGRRKDLTQT